MLTKINPEPAGHSTMAHPSCGLWVFSRLACTRRSSWPYESEFWHQTWWINILAFIIGHIRWFNMVNISRLVINHNVDIINQACLPTCFNISTGRSCGCLPGPQGAVFEDCDASIPFSQRHCWAWPSEDSIGCTDATGRFHPMVTFWVPLIMLSCSLWCLCTVHICIHYTPEWKDVESTVFNLSLVDVENGPVVSELMWFAPQEATGDEYLKHSTSSAAQHLGVFGMFGVGASEALDTLHMFTLL